MKFQFIIASLQYVTVPRTDGISKFTATLTRRLPTPVSTPSRPRIVLPSIEDKLETKLRIPGIVANRHTLQIIHSLDGSRARGTRRFPSLSSLLKILKKIFKSNGTFFFYCVPLLSSIGIYILIYTHIRINVNRESKRMEVIRESRAYRS